MPVDAKENAVADLEAILDIMPRPDSARVVLSGDDFDYSSLLAQASEVAGGLLEARSSTFKADIAKPPRELLLAIYSRQQEVVPYLRGEVVPDQQIHFPRKYISLDKIEWGGVRLPGEEGHSSQNYLISWEPSRVMIAHGSNPPEFIPRLQRELKIRNFLCMTDPELF